MKKRLLTLAAIAIVTLGSAQELRYDWKTMKPEQRKELIQQMKPEQRMMLLKQFRENMMISELEVPQDDQTEFKNLYSEYQEKQNAIKSKFKPAEDYDKMTDDEARKQVNESFEIGQQLLDNRRQYAEKFMKVIKPQQVLQMFQTEGKMRTKILDKKDGQQSPQRRRP